MNSPVLNNADRITSIQSLRGIAAILVLFAHLQKELLQKYAGAIPDYINIKISGQAGVDLFFVISGFIMVCISHGKVDTSNYVSNFLKKRFFRIVPLYWFYTTLTLAVSLLWASKKNSNDLSLGYVLSSYTFIPWQRAGDDHFTPLLGVGWTLNYEVYFYLFFALAILLLGTRYFWGLCGMLCVVVLAGAIIDIKQDQLWYWTRPIILEFVFGGLVARLFLAKLRLSAIWGGAVLAAGLVWWQMGSFYYPDPTLPELRVFTWGIPSALILGAVVLTPRMSATLGNTEHRLGRWLAAAGDSSYSLYLCHMFVLRMVSIAFPSTLIFFPLAIVCYVGISVAMAHYSYRFIEIPLNKFAARK